MYCSLTIFIYIYISLSLTIFDYQRVIIKYQVFHRPTDQIWNQKNEPLVIHKCRSCNFKGVRIYNREKTIKSVDASLDCFEDGFGPCSKTKGAHIIEGTHII